MALTGLRKPVLLLAPRKTVDVGAVAIAGVDDGALVGGLVPIIIEKKNTVLCKSSCDENYNLKKYLN